MKALFLSTEQLAELLKVKPTTIRTQYSRLGHYQGLVPCKLMNRRLLWLRDDVENLLGKHLDNIED